MDKKKEIAGIRDGDERDLEQILAMRKAVFGEMEEDKLDPRFWKWEFIENPDGKALIYIIRDEGRVVGHFADIPRDFSVEGETLKGTLSVDLMVDPEYRRKGFFFSMGKYAARRVAEENRLFMTAYPIRDETIQGLLKLGWKKVVKLPVLVYPIRFQGIIASYLHFRPLSVLLGAFANVLHLLLFRRGKKEGLQTVEIEKVVQLDGQFEVLCRKASSFHPIIGTRNRGYLTWRYIQHPTRTYTIYRARTGSEMVGYIVLRKVELLGFNCHVIVDLLALNEGVIPAMIEKGIQHSRQEGTDLLGFMVPKGHTYYRILRGMGFLPSMKSFQFMIYPIGHAEGLLSPERWYVNWGDTDVI